MPRISKETDTFIALPIRVAICANGIGIMRLPAVWITTSPLPQWLLWRQRATIHIQRYRQLRA